MLVSCNKQQQQRFYQRLQTFNFNIIFERLFHLRIDLPTDGGPTIMNSQFCIPHAPSGVCEVVYLPTRRQSAPSFSS